MSKEKKYTEKEFTFEPLQQLESNRRLREAMLYIAKRCQSDERFGMTKLNKILYFSDFLYYAKTGKAITGGKYMKLKNGPVAHQLKPVIEGMGKEEAVVQTRDYYGNVQRRVIHMREPDLSIFTGDQIAQIDEVIDFLSERNATEVSEISHDRAWRIASMNGFIPYEAVFISDEPITPFDRERTNQLASEQGWYA